MRFLDIDEERAVIALGLIQSVAQVDGTVAPAEQGLLDAAAVSLGLAAGAGPYPEPDGHGLASLSPKERERIVQMAILMSLMDGGICEAELVLVKRLATRLEIDEPRVRNIAQLARGRMLALAIDLARRSFARQTFVDAFDQQGIGGIWKIVGPMMGRARDPALAARYRALGQLPEGTLGRGYFSLLDDWNLSFPGEPYAVAEVGLWHDLAHVLGGYDASHEGEIGVVSFIAGFQGEDPFFWLFTLALQYQVGLKVSPYTEPCTGMFEPAAVLHAYQRGTAVNTDISQDWDPWPHFARPLVDVRRELNVPPP